MKSSSSRKDDGKVAPPRDAKEPSYSVPAVEKALDVLELLGKSSRGMNLTAIADSLGRSKQELFRVLICLRDRGYLVRDEGQGFRLSTKLFEIGSQHASTQMLIAHAMPHMERLARSLRESCHLTIVSRNQMLVVARAEGDADVMLAVRIGATFELHRRVSGLVGLAHLSEHQRRDYWKQSGETSEAIALHEAQFPAIRDQGYLSQESPIVVGVRDTATPILGAGASLLGVLCVSHLCRRDEPDHHGAIVDAVAECAASITAEYGPPHDGA